MKESARRGRMGPGGFLSLQNCCDPPRAGWVGSIPTRSRQRGLAAIAVLAAGLGAGTLGAQVPDTTARGPVRAPVLAVPRPAPAPPITPRRAFLYSLAIPGSAQSILDRPTAGAIFVATEAGALAMLAKSAQDLRAARRLAYDSVVVRYDTSGTTVTAVRALSPIAQRARSRIGPRRSFVEDWLTLVIVNHFLAGADAYVAANLWDVPTDVTVTPGSHGRLTIAAKLQW